MIYIIMDFFMYLNYFVVKYIIKRIFLKFVYLYRCWDVFNIWIENDLVSKLFLNINCLIYFLFIFMMNLYVKFKKENKKGFF